MEKDTPQERPSEPTATPSSEPKTNTWDDVKPDDATSDKPIGDAEKQ